MVWATLGAGKTADAKSLEAELHNRGLKVEVLDGDEVKRTSERTSKRVAWMNRVLYRNGVIRIVVLISSFRSNHRYALDLIGKDFVGVGLRLQS